MDTSDPKINNSQTHHSIIKSPSRTISVQAIGEAQCPPSNIQFGVSVSSVKDSLEAAQASVKRRTDYIIQVLRNNGIKEKNYKCSSEISRSEECVHLQTDILVKCDSVGRCETVRNLLIEKLDSSSVHFTSVTYHHLFEDKEEKRQEAFKKAVTNARSKAQSVSQTVGVQLGPAIEVIELSQDTTTGPDSVMDMELREPDPDSTKVELLSTNLHLQFAKETLVFRSRVSIVFDTQPLHMCTHKNCKKH